MSEILGSWADIAPKECHYVAHTWRLWLDGQFWILGDIDRASSKAIIQAAVQEAIEARRWRWVKEFGNSNAVCVYRPEIPLGTNRRAFVSREDGPLAQTSLDAYLQALEAN